MELKKFPSGVFIKRLITEPEPEGKNEPQILLKDGGQVMSIF